MQLPHLAQLLHRRLHAGIEMRLVETRRGGGELQVRVDAALLDQMEAMLNACYWSQLNQLPRQQWAEYFDGPTGSWIGQQARTQQTWTIVGFLLTHHLLRGKPADVDLLDIETTKNR